LVADKASAVPDTSEGMKEGRMHHAFVRVILLGATMFIAAVGASSAQTQTIRVGVTAGPHAEVLEVVRKTAAERGFTIKVIEFTDYVVPNQALAAKEIEANSFQHEPYLKNQIAKTGWKISKVAYTIASPMGFYSKKFKSFGDLPAGSSIAIQNDPTNAARSLQLLHANGIVTLKDPASVTASLLDISDNPKKYRFIELDAAQLPRSLADVDAAAVNNNYAVQAGLDPVKDPLIKETSNGPWVNIIAVRDEDRDQPWVAKLVEAYHSEPVKTFLAERFKGAYLPAW
jgi:D-methionine transport system substrate-binding protein